MRLIQGAGGGGGGKDGGGGGRSPIESPDSLRSRQYARVVDLVSEGEIVGLVNGLKSVYLNDTPVQNADNSFNFSGVTMVSRVGTQSQDYIPGFASVEAETAVSVPVEAAAPVVRSISNANANAVRVTVSVPQLSEQNTSNGDLGGTSVSIAIDVQTAGGGYVEKITDTISGKTTSRYQRAYRIDLTGSGPWDVRVRRLTPDSTSSALNNATNWDSYTEIVDAKLRYPNSALVAMAVDAERFSSIPKRGYEIKGLLVRIPSNYNPDTRAYTGIWDGTFTTAWTDNPAWHFYDMVTNDRYGLGNFIDASQVDKWALYEIAQHCDELVPDGFGGMEPRFTCTLYLQSREEAFKVINDMAAIFCGMAFWGTGSIIPAQDAPSEPVKLFSNANVVPSAEGMYFNYAGSSIKTRHTVALVSWNDPADRYKQKIEYVEDLAGIALYGIVQTEVVALGCTSRGQAHRYGRRILYTERMETETISFRAGLDGLDLAPGDVFQTTDPVRAGVRLGGRLVAATANTLTLDAAVTIDGAATYTLWAVLPNGAVESRAVVTGAGTTSTLSVSPDFSAAPQAMAMWVLAASNLAPEMWRAISISEAEGGTIAEISALKYSPNKYLEIEQGIVLEALPTSSLSTTQAAPSDLVISEDLCLITPSVVGARITASWQGNAARYEMQYRIKDGNWLTLTETTKTLDIQPVEPGFYEFTLTAISAIGNRSASITATKEILGKTAPPSDVAGLSIAILSTGLQVSWTPCPDLDYAETILKVGGSWSTGTVVDRAAASARLLGWRAAGSLTVWAAHVDTSGNVSGTPKAATIVLAPPPPPDALAIEFGTANIEARWAAPMLSAQQQPLDRVELAWTEEFSSVIDGKKATTATFGWLPAGSYTLFARYVDVGGNHGAPAQAVLLVNPPAQPVMTAVETQVNAVTLRWQDAKTSQPIRKYAIFYGDAGTAFGASALYGSAGADSRSDILFYRSAGAKVAYLQAEDVAGNLSAPRQIDLSITMPNDFVLASEYYEDWHSAELVNGTIVGGAGGQIILPTYVGRTWAQRLSDYGWATAQQKVDAGYPLVIQPVPSTGKHLERRDLGRVIPAAVVRATPTLQSSVAGAVATVRIRGSVGASDTSWQPWLVGESVVLADFQHLEVEFSVSSDGKGFVVLDDIYVRVEISEVSESAVLTLSASDAGGTEFVCQKSYLDVRTVQATPLSSPGIARLNCIVDDGVSPAKVYVQAWDTSNNRTSGVVSLTISGV